MIENPFYLLDEAVNRGSKEAWDGYSADEQREMRANPRSIYYRTAFPLKKKDNVKRADEPHNRHKSNKAAIDANEKRNVEHGQNRIWRNGRGEAHNEFRRKNAEAHQRVLDKEHDKHDSDNSAHEHLEDLHRPLTAKSAISLAAGATKEVSNVMAKTFLNWNPEVDVKVMEELSDPQTKERKTLARGVKNLMKASGHFAKELGAEWKHGAHGLHRFATTPGSLADRWGALSEHEKNGVKAIGKELALAIGTVCATGEMGHILVEHGFHQNAIKAFSEAVGVDIARTAILSVGIKGGWYAVHSLFADSNGDAEAAAMLKSLFERSAYIASTASFDPNMLIKNMIEVQKGLNKAETPKTTPNKPAPRPTVKKESAKPVRYTDFLSECRNSLVGMVDEQTMKIIYTIPSNVAAYMQMGLRRLTEDTRSELRDAMQKSGLYRHLGDRADDEIDRVLDDMFAHADMTTDESLVVGVKSSAS